jgi:hypothetical protein
LKRKKKPSWSGRKQRQLTILRAEEEEEEEGVEVKAAKMAKSKTLMEEVLVSLQVVEPSRYSISVL